MKPSYTQKLFLYFVVLFVVFTVGIIVVEQSHERKSKTETLEAKLNEIEFYNGLFIQYQNVIANKSNSEPTIIFRHFKFLPNFKEILNKKIVLSSKVYYLKQVKHLQRFTFLKRYTGSHKKYF